MYGTSSCEPVPCTELECAVAGEDVNGTPYLVHYPSIACNSSAYSGLMPLFTTLTVVVVVGFPIMSLALVVARKRQGTLYQTAFKQKFGILWVTFVICC